MNLMQNLSNNFPNFIKGFELMGFGMAGIFIVLMLLFASVKVLIKLFPGK